MPGLIVRGLDAQTVKRLKDRAKRHGRSLEGEARQILEQAAGSSAEAVRAVLEGWRNRLHGRKLKSSVALIREDRAR